MPHFTDEDKHLMEEIRSRLDSIQDALEKSPWYKSGKFFDLDNTADRTGEAIIRELKFIRQHIKSGCADPSLEMIQNRLLFVNGATGLSLEDLLEQMLKRVPSTKLFMEEVQIPRLILAQINWSNYRPDIIPPDNYYLPPDHPDRTDRYGHPFYVATDAEGIPLKDSDVSLLSQTREAINAREKMKYGAVRPKNNPRNPTITPYIRMKRPAISAEVERQYQEDVKAYSGVREQDKKNLEETNKAHEKAKKREKREPQPQIGIPQRESFAGGSIDVGEPTE